MADSQAGKLTLQPAVLGGLSHYLDGREVFRTSELEIEIEEGVWIRGRYSWAFTADTDPVIIASSGEVAITPHCRLRWPSTV
jgi:hypothetical protein